MAATDDPQAAEDVYLQAGLTFCRYASSLRKAPRPLAPRPPLPRLFKAQWLTRTRAGEVARAAEVSPGVTIEYNDNGDVIGVEILRASKVLAEPVVAGLHAKQAGVI